MTDAMKITHVIFDMDGLLLNTEDLYTEMFHLMCGKWGGTFSYEIKHRIMGRKLKEAVKMLIDEQGMSCGVEEFVEYQYSIQEDYFKTSQRMAGVDRLIDHLHANKIPICVATSSDAVSFGHKTGHHEDFFSKFNHIVKGTDPDVKHGKPSPDIFLVAASRFDPPADPRNCLVFEDAKLGVEAAQAAGMPVVWVPSVPGTDTGSLDPPPTEVLDSLANFKPEVYHLPPF